jgi:flagellar hook-length control protein FliK
MQTTTLAIQISNSASAAPQRAQAAPSHAGAPFSQALAREVAQRQPSAPAAAPPAGPPGEKAAEGKPASASADASADQDDAADAAVAPPAADMLALVASLQLPAAPAAGKHGVVADAFSGTGAARRAQPLTASAAANQADRLAAALPTGMVLADAGIAAQADARTAHMPAAQVLDIAALTEPAPTAPAIASVQQAALAMTPALADAAGGRIAARVGAPGWDSEVGQKIVWMVAGKEQSASLTLNPPDLGPMQVVLKVTNDQASVTFTAAQPEVRQALEDAMPRLREMMSESGIALGNASVSAGTQDQRQAWQGEQARGAGSRGGGAGGNEATVAEAPRRTGAGSGIGLVDTFA